jgi:hypothetical protein
MLAGVPEVSLDPFSRAFFDDPYPGHEAVREAASVVRLPVLEAQVMRWIERVKQESAAQ